MVSICSQLAICQWLRLIFISVWMAFDRLFALLTSTCQKTRIYAILFVSLFQVLAGHVVTDSEHYSAGYPIPNVSTDTCDDITPGKTILLSAVTHPKKAKDWQCDTMNFACNNRATFNTYVTFYYYKEKHLKAYTDFSCFACARLHLKHK